jgi:hypothetical protein
MTSRPLSDELLLGSGGLVWITFDNASGHRAISGLELVLEGEVHSRAMLGQAIVDLRAAITVNQTRTGWLRLGTAITRSAVHLPPGMEGRDRRTELSLMLDQVTLAGLEAARDGDDLRLHLDLAATAITNDGLPLAGHQQVQWTIPSEQWIRVLDQAHTHQHVTILSSAPDADSSEGYRRAGQELQVANAALRSGRYPDAVMAVRKGIDHLGARKLQAPRSQTDRNDRSVDERYGTLADALHHLASVAAHPEGPNTHYAWTRDDATAAIAGLMALMQRTT